MEFPVPAESLIGLEHPCIIRDASEAVRSLDGQRRLKEIVNTSTVDREATLCLKPDDPMSVPILSCNTVSNDLLLAVEVPRIIGRKRKRRCPATNSTAPGAPSDGERSTQESTDEMPPTKRLLRSSKDRPHQIRLSVVGTIDRTHRFRDLPDFGFASSTGPFMKQFESKLLSLDYERIKQFRFDPTNPKYSGTEIIPPPSFSTVQIPFNYLYRQNFLAVPIAPDAGSLETSKKFNRSLRTYAPRVPSDITVVPSEPPSVVAPLDELDQESRELIAELKALFDRRPIWTRRAIMNHLPKSIWKTLFRQVHQYVAYMFRSGPWRECMVKLGFDPRLDPANRIYQTLFFILDSEYGRQGHEKGHERPGQLRGGNRRVGVKKPSVYGVDELGGDSHIFDGQKLALDSKVWQVCDITDPQVVEVLSTTNLRKRCHLKSDGWFHNGTWAKARLITRTKIQSIIRGDLVLYRPGLDQVAQFPESVNTDNRSLTMIQRNDSPHFMELAEQFRGNLATPEPTTGSAERDGISTSKAAHQDPRVEENVSVIDELQELVDRHPSISDDVDGGDEEFEKLDEDPAMMYAADYGEVSEVATDEDEDARIEYYDD